MELNRIIADLEVRLQLAEKAAQEVPRLRRQLQTAKEMKAYYENSAAEQGGNPLALIDRARQAVEASASLDDWNEIPRTTAVERVLKESAKPLSPSQIIELLARHGRADERPNIISAVLANLRKQGKVKKSSTYGKWVAVQEVPAPKESGLFVSSS